MVILNKNVIINFCVDNADDHFLLDKFEVPLRIIPKSKRTCNFLADFDDGAKANYLYNVNFLKFQILIKTNLIEKAR